MAVDNVSAILPQIAGAIRQAASSTGASFEYLLTTAQIESHLNPGAQAATSSAGGLYQFIDQTWLATVKNAGAAFGLGQYSQAIVQAPDGHFEVPNTAARTAIMKLRSDPNVSAVMAGAFARNNAAQLASSLGRQPSEAELYLAHFLGAAGARTFLGALQTSPDMSAAALFPKPAAANQAIFFDGGRPRAVAEVMDLLKAKVGTAMGEGVDAVAPGTSFAYAAPTQAFQAAQADFAPAAPTASSAPAPRRASMAETLQATFGGSDRIGARAAQRIDEAYGKFRAFGL